MPATGETRLAIQRRYRQKHRARLAADLKDWARRNPEKYRAKWQRGQVRNRAKRAAATRLYLNLTPGERALRSAVRDERRRREQDSKRVGQARGRWGRRPLGPQLSPREQRVRSNLYLRRLRARDPQHAISCRLRASLDQALRRSGTRKCASTFKLVGCTAVELVVHLEALFLAGMGWHNRSLWDVDHKRPLRAFDLRDPEQQRAAMHFTNLRPLWRRENRAKWDRLADGTLARHVPTG